MVLEATAEATVPSGNVYLYDGNTAGVSDAQKLILAETATLKTTVEATAEFLPPGIAGREEDDRRSRGRIAGARGDPRGLR